jgi:hypothetical protein
VNRDDAFAELYRLALFGPGATVPGSSATFANVLLRAERALAGVSLSDELAALRRELDERQERLQRVHDVLAGARERARKANGG